MESHSFSASFTDLMTSLAVIFILLFVATMSNVFQQGESTRNAILAELKKDLDVFSEKGVYVEPDPADPLSILIYVPKDLLNFEPNKYDIPPDGKVFLNKFIPPLSAILCSLKFSDDINSILVEGHTDNTGDQSLNLPLSQNRSMAVVMESLKDFDSENDKNCFLKKLSASGRSNAEPYIDPETKQIDWGKSRRVVFKIRIRGLEQRRGVEQQVEHHI